ncbi:MAG: hypothetical protein HY200_03080 [Nitrospirae bacterium]|nr:hypothetical protein [Nitrospirota bacterium]MBI3593916.1 hypothetical protein [Nitrospirota bacterium]
MEIVYIIWLKDSKKLFSKYGKNVGYKTREEAEKAILDGIINGEIQEVKIY